MKQKQLLYFGIIYAVLAFLSQAGALRAYSQTGDGGTLGLDEYLAQVRAGNSGFKAASEGAEAGQLRARERTLLVSPMFYGNAQYTHDGKPPLTPLFSYDYQNTAVFSFGFSQVTPIGLNAKLHYDVMNFGYDGIRGFPGLTTFATYNNAVVLELTQSLWANGFGRGTRATQDAIEASAQASGHGARFQAKAALAQAETSFWRLAAARQVIRIESDIMGRARKTQDWAARRAQLQLGDRSDALQANAAYQLRQLELQAAQDEERLAARAFNEARGLDSDTVSERLPELNVDVIQKLSAVTKADMRDDVKAALAQQKAVAANAQASLERDTPTLELFGSVALNGQNVGLGSAASQSFTVDHPTEMVGIRFSAPILVGAALDSRKGWHKERVAAELAYERKVFEQDQEWKSLNDRLGQARRRLELAVALAKVQSDKINHERNRLSAGRTTTYQVLAFEQDYASAELNRIRSELEVLGILAQLKLFGEQL